jgi:hypothetical protein
MQKYRVIVHGQNLLTEVDGVRQRLGFYTNVFVEAFTAADAEARAIELVREDAHLHDITLNVEGDALSLSADEVQEIESFDGVRLPRTGLSLYEEKSGET